MTVVLVDATCNSITVSWNEVKGSHTYILQYRPSHDESFTTLSDKLTSTQARKKNLDSGQQYFFRVRALRDEEDDPTTWMIHTEPFSVLSTEQENNRMKAPRASLGGSNHTVLVQWDKGSLPVDTRVPAYELQMREHSGGAEWSTVVASLSGTEVKKKNLTAHFGYQFRVREVGSEVFSGPCDPIISLGISSGVKSLFKSLKDGTLLKHKSKVSLADSLGGKEIIILYASASWCGPCRQFTPTLTQWYQNIAPNHGVEVVFLSADHDARSMESYYSKMPWLAVEFDDDAREALLGYIKVTSIPRLVVLDGRTGSIIVDNAVGQQLDLNHWKRLAQQK